ncbi:DUF5339 domain-containing protein [Entomohabitans teleogrylli]|uniref:DUF5339 domain-containing protein n=1 Tax=Entomohabitans teleogrylli TaxID=1384589 RepID=UPI00073DA831|nr:DUF5339 domain-containing protein [Entomohabitans teleogrylli]
MKKILLSGVILMSSFSVLAASDACETYFSEMNALVTQLSESDATKAQADMLKQQLDQAKTQMETLPAESKTAACQQGVDALAQMKSAMGMQ